MAGVQITYLINIIIDYIYKACSLSNGIDDDKLNVLNIKFIYF